MIDLKRQFNNTAELYRIELCKLWDVRYSDTYWIADEVGGGLDVECYFVLTMDEIRYIVDNRISYETVNAWTDYNVAVSAIKDKLHEINLQSWCNGCPHVDASKFYDQLIESAHGRD